MLHYSRCSLYIVEIVVAIVVVVVLVAVVVVVVIEVQWNGNIKNCHRGGIINYICVVVVGIRISVKIVVL